MAKKAKKAKKTKKAAGKPKASASSGFTVGIMHSGSGPSGATPSAHDKNIKAFQKALKAAYGTVTYNGPHWADDSPGTLNHNAQTLVSAQVDLLVAAGGTASAGQAKNNTTTIPIVFTSGTDSAIAVPNPGIDRNMTGVCARTSGLDADRLKLLHELFPQAKQFGALFNLQRPNYPTQTVSLNGTAMELGLNPLAERAVDPMATASIKSQIDDAYTYFQSQSCAAVLVTADPLFNNHRQDVLRTGPGAAAPLRTPLAIYQWREFAEEGGLISYGPDLQVAYQLAGIRAASILQQVAAGTAINYPAVLVLNSFELVINLQTAMAKNIDIPDSVLSRADEIIV
jgi:putative tryptophan/tyrosine transport system substrate-binding protein